MRRNSSTKRTSVNNNGRVSIDIREQSMDSRLKERSLEFRADGQRAFSLYVFDKPWASYPRYEIEVDRVRSLSDNFCVE